MPLDILAAAAFFPTDVHNGTLGEGESADTLQRFNDIKGELIILWGRQDPHIPNEGKKKEREGEGDRRGKKGEVRRNGEGEIRRLFRGSMISRAN